MHFEPADLDLATSLDPLRGRVEGFWRLLDLVQNHRRKVPVPRRIARYLAGGASRVEAATILAHLLRCCYLRGGRVAASGNCLASWVEEVFGVHASSVKQARARLVRLGMFVEHDMPQWHKNRHGARIEINLAWSRETPTTVGEGGTTGTTQGTESRPPVGVFHNQTATPIENRSLPTEGQKNQTPGAQAPKTPSGVLPTTSRKPRSEPVGVPSLRHFVGEDLVATDRLLQLHEQAVGQGLVPAGERGELEFVALAEHARAYATRNAPGMFAWLVRNYARTAKRFVNAEDEEAARRRLRDHREPPAPALFALAARPLRLLSSRCDSEPKALLDQQAIDDARFVSELLRALAARGVRDEERAFSELQRAKPEWTEERWLRARWSGCRRDAETSAE